MRPPLPRSTPPRPRLHWEALLALLATGSISLALPPALAVGPPWLVPVVVAVLLIPTVAAHRAGRHSLYHLFGIVSNAAITLSLCGSLALLVFALPARKEPPVTLLTSALLLWVANIATFALWYWRLDGGGPVSRLSRGQYGSRAFLFPQLQIEQSDRQAMGTETWAPRFVDYLFYAFNTSTAFSPSDTLVLARWAKLLTMAQALISLLVLVLLVARGINVL